jgi:hypothetical protein
MSGLEGLDQVDRVEGANRGAVWVFYLLLEGKRGASVLVRRVVKIDMYI